MSCSWDKTVKFWNIDSPDPKSPTYSFSLSNKAYMMSVSQNLYAQQNALIPRKLFVLCDNRQIVVYDLANSPILLCEKESVLKFGLRSIAAFSDGNGYVVGSIEGRVGVEYISSSEQEKPFSFRCHRKTDAYNELCYPVNSICVHPLYCLTSWSTCRYRTFATGGADGSVCIWDASAKKRLAIFQE